MSAVTAEKKRWTPEEYLEMERHSLDKHEYFDGEIFLMAGASIEHNLVVAGLISSLSGALAGKCLVLTSDQRLLIPVTGLYTYADASVVCGAPDLTQDSPAALRNPKVIFEVLSDTSERYDRGKKFAQYRTIPSLTDYIILSQDQILVEHYHLQGGGGWLFQELRQGSVGLDCGAVPIAPVYQQRLAYSSLASP